MKVRNKQCEKCPWKKSTNPHEIPDGYSVELHKKLKETIATPGALNQTSTSAMSCHEHPPGDEVPCVGWLLHQLGPGNNLPLRLMAMNGKFEHVDWPDPDTQHQRFEDTLPDEEAHVIEAEEDQEETEEVEIEGYDPETSVYG